MRASICLVFLCGLAAAQPYVVQRISVPLINSVKEGGISIVDKALSSRALPDVKGTYETPIGMNIEYALTNIALTSVSLAGTQFTVVPPAAARLHTPDGTAALSFSWMYRQSAWPHVTDSGTGEVQISGTTVTAVVSLSAANGVPLPRVASLDVAIRSMQVKLSGGDGWLYQMVVDLVSSRIKSEAENGLRDAIRNAIDTQATSLLASLPFNEPITSIASLDLHLTASPMVTETDIITQHVGIVTSANGTRPQLTGYVVPAIPDVSDGQMLQYAVSEALFDSAGVVYHQSGALTYDVTSLPADAAFQLDVDSFADAVPPLGDAYPDNHPLAVHIMAASGPDFRFNTTAVTIRLPLTIGVSVLLPDGAQPAFVLRCGIDFEGSLRVDGAKIVGDVSVLTASLSLQASRVGNFSVAPLEQLLTFVINHAVVPKVAEVVRAGYPLPVPKGVTLVRPTLMLRDGYMLLSSDLVVDLSVVAALVGA